MKTTINYTFFTLLWVTLLCTSLSSARAQTVEWIRQLGTTTYDISSSVTTDALGNVYISGTTEGDFATGSGPGTDIIGTDAFVSKYNSAGTLAWTKQLGTRKSDGRRKRDGSNGVTTDALGNVYISGFTQGDLAGPETHAGNYDAFVRKYDSTGTLDWTRQLGTRGNDRSFGVTTDALGNVYLSGTTERDIDGSGPGTHAGADDAFLTKYDSAGNLTWTRQLGTTDRDKSSSVTTDAFGNVYISGFTQGDIDGPGSETHAGGYDAFVRKYDSTGTLAWTKQLGTSDTDGSSSVTTDASGNVYISGYTWDDLDGSGPGSHAGSYDGFLAKYDSAGNLAWTKQLGTTTYDISSSITTDAFGNVYLSGYTYGDLDGDGPETHSGDADVFVRKYDSSGTLAWTKQLGSSTYDISSSITTDASGNIYLSGFTQGDIDGSGPGAYSGDYDAFLIKIHDDSFVAVAVPEPNAIVLMLLAVASLYVCNRHTSSQAARRRKA